MFKYVLLKVFVVFAICSSAFWQSPANAQETDVEADVQGASADSSLASLQAKASDVGSFGSFVYEYPIEVPQNFGIEPKLSLKYDSNRKTKTGGLYQGWLGYGWGLEGFSVIERARPGQGVPAYDAKDIYLLNGQPLASCASTDAAGASCAAGGNWVSEVENYLKIRFVAASNTWEVTARDGTKTIFSSTADIAGSSSTELEDTKYRWLVKTVKDIHGNLVNYTYNCPALPVCYPRAITFNDRSVSFAYEERPDHILMANGLTISQTTSRIKTVLVKTNGAVTAGYALAYESAPKSDASRLVSVKRYGTDLTLDDTNGIASGTSLPATVFTYSDSDGFSNVQTIEEIKGAPQKLASDGSGYWRQTFYPMDVNADGISEILRFTGSDGDTNCTYNLTFSPDDNTTFKNKSFPGLKCYNPLIHNQHFSADTLVPGFHLGHFRSGGRSTQLLVREQVSPQKIRWEASFTKSADDFVLEVNDCNVETGAGAVTDAKVKALCGKDYENDLALDHNGDGIDELVDPSSRFIGTAELYGDGSITRLRTDDGDLIATTWVDGVSQQRNVGETNCTKSCIFGDLNGDGLDDLLHISVRCTARRDHDTRCISTGTTYLFNGVKFVQKAEIELSAPSISEGNQLSSGYISSFVADADADGKVEFGIGLGHTQEGYVFKARSWSILRLKQSASGAEFERTAAGFFSSFVASGDFNGDGLGDLFTAPAVSCGSPLNTNDKDPYTWGDYRSDCYEAFSTTPYLIRYGRGTSGLPNLLYGIETPDGGSVGLSYARSTKWENTYLPFALPTVSTVSVSDGRGTVSATSYSYGKGLYLPGRRKFMGFGEVTKTLPKAAGQTTASKVTTTYLQGMATVGLPSTTESLDSAGDVRQVVANAYAANNSTVPYSALNTVTRTDHIQGDITRSLRVNRSFDDYGNVIEETDYGRTDVAGDETTTLRAYLYNTSAYLVSSPRGESVYDGTSSEGTLLTRQQFVYDGLEFAAAPTEGLLTEQRDFTSGSAYQATTFTYDDTYGNRISQTNAEGEKTTWTYDDNYHLFVILTTYPNGLTKRTGWNTICAAPAWSRDFSGVTTTYSYDELCRQTEAINAVTGAFTQTAYSTWGNPATQFIVTRTSRPNVATTTVKRDYIDGLGRAWRTETVGDETAAVQTSPTTLVDTVYDPRGNAAEISLPYETGTTARWTKTTYDWNNRPIEVTNPPVPGQEPTAKTYGYSLPDTLSNTSNIPLWLTVAADEIGGQIRTYTSTAGDTIGVQQRTPPANDGTAQTRWIHAASFDGAHRMVEARDHGGAIWTYSYDLMGNRRTVDDPDLGTWIYAYDRANRLVRQRDARGAVTVITYDKLGRVDKKIAYANATQANAETDGLVLAENIYDQARTGYYNKGQLTTAQSPGVTQTMDYNGDGLVERKRVAIGGVTHQEDIGYDQGRVPLYKSYSSADTTTINVGNADNPWIYNVKAQLIRIPGYINGITYVPDGQTETITYANGVTTTFTYSPQRRWLTRLETKAADGSTLMIAIYTRDDIGRITAVNEGGTASDWEYTYDGFGRLVNSLNADNTASVLSEDFRYTASDNLVSRSRLNGSFVYPAGTAARPHAPLSLNGESFSYDANGNLLSDGSRTFTYDLANRVSKVVNAANAPVAFVYGPDGTRARKSSTTGTTYYYDANVEYDPTTTTFTRYPHMDIKVAGTKKYFLHRDHLSSVRFVTDSTGAVAETTRYGSYGEPTNKNTDTQKTYIGERYDAETDLVYLNARYMDPKFGRFISPDDWDPTLEGVEETRVARND